MKLSEFFPQMEGATPIEPTIPAAPQIPNNQTQVSPYLRTTLPLPLQYSPDTLKQYNRPGLSSFRIAPLPPGGNPSINAASSSVSQTNIQSFVSIAAGGPNTSIQFNNGGSLGGVSRLEWDNTNSILNINGGLTVIGTINASIVNATTGFQIGAAAVSGKVLRGNGTNFVSASLAASDLSNGVTGTGLVVLQTSPTLITPILGIASGTSVSLTPGSGATAVKVVPPDAGTTVEIGGRDVANATWLWQIQNGGSAFFPNVDVVNGYTIGGAAPSGHVLRGNGTRYVDGSLAASDLSNGTTGTTSVVLSVSPTITTPKWTAYTVATLPVGSEGQYAYASDGRKVGEAPAAGTGVPVYFSNSLWRVFSTDLQVLA